MGRKKVYFEELLQLNPFVENLTLESVSFCKKESYVSVKSNLNAIVSFYTVDKNGFCKVFNDEHQYERIKLLKHSTRSFLMYIIYHLPSSKDYIRLQFSKVTCDVGIKCPITFKKCIQELIDNEFIKLSECEDVYWVNPLFFFKGSRIEKYKEKVTHNRNAYTANTKES